MILVLVIIGIIAFVIIYINSNQSNQSKQEITSTLPILTLPLPINSETNNSINIYNLSNNDSIFKSISSQSPIISQSIPSQSSQSPIPSQTSQSPIPSQTSQSPIISQVSQSIQPIQRMPPQTIIAPTTIAPTTIAPTTINPLPTTTPTTPTTINPLTTIPSKTWDISMRAGTGNIVFMFGKNQALNINIKSNGTVISAWDGDEWGPDVWNISQFHNYDKYREPPLIFKITFNIDNGFTINYKLQNIATYPNKFNITNIDDLKPVLANGITIQEQQLLTFKKLDKTNCVWGRLSEPKTSGSDYKYIGDFNTLEECAANPNIDTNAKAITLHGNNSGGYSRQCYSINDNNTRVTNQNDAVCGILSPVPIVQQPTTTKTWDVIWTAGIGSIMFMVGNTQQALHLNIRDEGTVMSAWDGSRWSPEVWDIKQFHNNNQNRNPPLRFKIIFNTANGFTIIYQNTEIAKYPNKFNITNADDLIAKVLPIGGISILELKTTTQAPTTITTQVPTTITTQAPITPTTTKAPDDFLYEFKTHTFTNAKATGSNGPTLEQIREEYKINWTYKYINMINDDGIQLWTVPISGYYFINAIGAAGGNSNIYGKGRSVQLITILNKGEVIKILVGQKGSKTINNSAGGGGGTFVIRYTQTPIIIAGGGGGRGDSNDEDYNSNGSFNAYGNNGAGDIFGNEKKWGSSTPWPYPNSRCWIPFLGKNEDGCNPPNTALAFARGGRYGGGGNDSYYGVGGGGLLNSKSSNFWGVESFIQGGKGGNLSSDYFSGRSISIGIGGFGGGGCCSIGLLDKGDKGVGGGGGGGYSGGGGGGYDNDFGWLGGGGGGSFGITTLTDNGAINDANGTVLITFLSTSVPTIQENNFITLQRQIQLKLEEQQKEDKLLKKKNKINEKEYQRIIEEDKAETLRRSTIFLLTNSSEIGYGVYRQVSNSKFRLTNNLTKWFMKIQISSNQYNGSIQGIIGNAYNSEVASIGWGLFIDRTGCLYWSSLNSIYYLNNLKLIDRNSYEIRINFRENILKFYLINRASDEIKIQSCNKDYIETNIGFVTVGGEWMNKPEQKFKGNIIWVEMLVTDQELDIYRDTTNLPNN